MSSDADAKSVLLVTYYWPPAGGAGVQRFLKFARYLPQFNIKPVVLTVSNPTYPSRDPELEAEVPPDLPVYSSHALEPLQWYARLTGQTLETSAAPVSGLSGGSNLTGRIAAWLRANLFIPDARLGWVPGAVIRAHELMQRYRSHAVITTGTPHSAHLIGLYLKTRLRYRWLADFRDPWVDIHYNQLLPRSVPAIRLDRKLEAAVWKNADERIVVSPGMKRHYSGLYSEPSHIITNGYDPDDFPDPPEKSDTVSRLTIRHVGTVPESSVPETFFKVLSRLPSTGYRMDWVGSIHEKIRHITRQLNLEANTGFTGYVSRDEAARQMQTADLLLLIIPQVRHAEGILTGKLFNYLGSGNPILMLGPTDGDAARIIRETGSGWCFEHADLAGIQHFMEKIISDNKTLRSVSPDRRKIEPYNRVNQARQLAKLI